MAKINLLPWREELRQERKVQFLSALGAVAVVAVLLTGLGYVGLEAAIANQNARNDFIKKEIAVLDTRITEIKELQTQRQQLIERMKIIQDLQLNRPISARVFDQLTRTLPEGLYYDSVILKGLELTVSGAAESNNRISEMMRNMEASEWLDKPTLSQVKLKTAGELEQASDFKLTVQQTRPGDLAEEGGAQ